jgi:hypothetical protein
MTETTSRLCGSMSIKTDTALNIMDKITYTIVTIIALISDRNAEIIIVIATKGRIGSIRNNCLIITEKENNSPVFTK